MPFPIILWEDKESLNYAHQFICSYTLTAFVSEILLVLRHSLVLFLPHLLILLYHVLSMKYFEDDALFIPKYRRIFCFYGLLHTFDCCLVTTAQRRVALIAAERSYTRCKYHYT